MDTQVNVPVLKLASTNNVEIGDKIYAIGCPLGLQNTVSTGIVSAFNNENGLSKIQYTAPISSGSSGGALINNHGKVIGITYASYSDGQNINLAIPTEEFSDISLDGNIISFEEISTMYKSIGNSIINYSADGKVVECGNIVYHSQNVECEIMKYDFKEKIEKSLGIKGSWLNIYHGNLYYADDSFDKNEKEDINLINLKTNKEEKGILRKNNIIDYNNDNKISISALYCIDEGIFVIYTSSKNYDINPNTGKQYTFLEKHNLEKAEGITELLKLDYDYNVKERIRNISQDSIMILDGYIATLESGNKIKIISLSDFSTYNIDLPYESNNIYSNGNGYIFATNIELDNPQYFQYYDIENDKWGSIFLEDASNYAYSVIDNNIFYNTYIRNIYV